MKRGEQIAAALGAAFVLAGSLSIQRAEPPSRNLVLEGGGCHTPATLLEVPHASRVTVVVLHGLAANRRVMKKLGNWLAAAGARVYLLDLPGHGDSMEAWSFARAEACAGAALATLAERNPKSDRMALVGHSMGGAIAVRLADRVPVFATIAISPAPMILPRRMPANLLVLSAQYDLSILRHEARSLAQAAGGERYTSTDFTEERAFRLVRVPHATHTGLLFDPFVARQVVRWLAVAFPGQVSAAARPRPGALRGAAIGFFGLLLLFPFVATLATRALRASNAESARALPSGRAATLRWIVATLFAVSVLYYFVPLKTLAPLVSGAYLASLLLISGPLLIALLWQFAKLQLRLSGKAVLTAGALGLAAFLALGAWLNWQLTDAWLNAPRWLRFAVLLPACWPYHFAEEVALGPPIGHGTRRLIQFLWLRLLLWFGCLFGILVLASGEILLFLLGIYFAGFSVLARLGADAVRRRTGSATAAATFGAILAAWFIAAVFPLA